MTTLTGIYCPGSNKPYASQKRVVVRCTSCNRRLLLAEVTDEDDLLLGFRIPRHKPKEKTTKKIVRKARGTNR